MSGGRVNDRAVGVGAAALDPAQRRAGRRILAAVRVVVAAVVVTAVFSQLALYLTYWRRIGLHDIGSRVADFFSAFTFEANLLGAALLLIGAVVLWRARGGEPRRLTTGRLCVLAAVVLTGIVYNLLLRGLPVPAGSQLDWANEVLHVWAPVALVLDWLLAPGRAPLRLRSAPVVLVYPILWLVYTMVRGVLVPDELERTPYYYPYPFLDPHGPGGWTSIAVIVGVLIVVTLLIGVLAILAAWAEARLRRGRRMSTASSAPERGPGPF